MKYFETNEPYYALVKAKSLSAAIEEYENVIADDEEGVLKEEMHEVEKDYALASFSQTPSEDGELIPIKNILEMFNDDNIKILIVDGSLL